MQQDYSGFLQRQVAVSVSVAAVVLAGISFARLLLYFDNTVVQALANPSVLAVAVIGLLFLASTARRGPAGRAIQVLVAFGTSCGAAFARGGGDLTSTVFLIAALMLASEYGFFTSRTLLRIGLPLAVYVICFFVGTYIATGAILASVHVLLAAGLMAFIFVAIIRTRLEQVRNREDELESVVAERTQGLQREVNRRARLEAELRDNAETSQRLASERALLLHELHHRTKNDLQLIASMIRLHGEDAASSDSKSILESAEDRIMAIALVHEYLYGSDELSAIGLDEYLDGLISYMRSAHSGTVMSIEEDIHTGLAVGIEPAIHIGLALNELVQNARKHAFPSGTAGTVTIRGVRVGDELHLDIADDGVGFGTTPQSNGSIGMEIVEGLVSQLEGTITLDTSEHTLWHLVLPVQFLQTRAGNNQSAPTSVEDTTLASRGVMPSNTEGTNEGK